MKDELAMDTCFAIFMLFAVIPIACALGLLYFLHQAYIAGMKGLRWLWTPLMVRAGWPHPYPRPEEGKDDEQAR